MCDPFPDSTAAQVVSASAVGLSRSDTPVSGGSPCVMWAAWDPSDTAGAGCTERDLSAAWGQTSTGPRGSVTPWDGAADSRSDGTLPSGAREPRDGDGMAVTCPVAPGGFQHRDRSADVAIFAVSGTSETVAADQTRSWHLLAAVLASRPRKEGADHW